jgi:hypothetical protein
MNDTSSNGQTTTQPDEVRQAAPGDAVRQAAAGYIRRGLFPVPADPRSKRCTVNGWTELRLTEASLDEYFPSSKSLNVGLLTVNGLLDVDLDVPEAALAANVLLPETSMVCGRRSHPMSHRFFACHAEADVATERFKDLDRKTLVELRGRGSMTIAPPSLHRESGEKIVWHEQGQPSPVVPEGLREDVALVAAATLLARHWPHQGGRHEAYLALAGGLLTGGWEQEEAVVFVRAVAAATRDNELRDREATVASTVERIADGLPVAEWRQLGEALPDRGPAVVRRVQKWLGLDAVRVRDDSAATQLVALAAGLGVELFHTPDRKTFAAYLVGEHREVWPVKSTTFRQWLGRQFYVTSRRAAGSQAMAAALNVIEGIALYQGAERTVHVRTAEHGGRIYIDLGDAEWRAIEIDAALLPVGWRLVKEPPVFFRRTGATLPLPEPVPGGSLDDLQPFVNVKPGGDWFLTLGFIVTALRPGVPYPVLALAGEEGTAKSTLGRMLQLLIDPNAGELRSEPREARDVMIAANGCQLIAYDNLSKLDQWLSDLLCRLSTGGGHGVREHYSNDEEWVFRAIRPTLLTSITDVIVSGDLLSRTIGLELQPIEEVRPERELMELFNQARPRLLGAVCTAMANGLHNAPNVKLQGLPRMADACHWAESCLRGAGVKDFTDGAFQTAFENNRKATGAVLLEGCPLVPYLVAVGSFEGGAKQLLDLLNQKAGEEVRKQRAWPKQPNTLSGTLKKIAPGLRRIGLNVRFEVVGHERRRVIHLDRKDRKEKRSSASSAPDVKDSPEKDLSADDPPEPDRPQTVCTSSAEGGADDPRTMGGRSADGLRTTRFGGIVRS